MGEPSLFERRPILSAPLRWRVELAALCLLFAVVGRWLPWQLATGLGLPIMLAALIVIAYPYGNDADLSLLKPKNPRLELLIAICCVVGGLATFTVRMVTDDFTIRDGSYFFLLGSFLARPLGWPPKTPATKHSPSD